MFKFPREAVRLANAWTHDEPTEELLGPFLRWVQGRISEWSGPTQIHDNEAANLVFLFQDLQAQTESLADLKKWELTCLDCIKREQTLRRQQSAGPDREPCVNRLLRAVGEREVLEARAYLQRSREFFGLARSAFSEELCGLYSQALNSADSELGALERGSSDTAAFQEAASVIGLLWSWDEEQRRQRSSGPRRYRHLLPSFPAPELESALQALAALSPQEQEGALQRFWPPMQARLNAAWQEERAGYWLLAKPGQVEEVESLLGQISYDSLSILEQALGRLDRCLQHLPTFPLGMPYFQVLCGVVEETVPDLALLDLLERCPPPPEVQAALEDYLHNGELAHLRRCAAWLGG